jgi:hypothetical protein
VKKSGAVEAPVGRGSVRAEVGASSSARTEPRPTRSLALPEIEKPESGTENSGNETGFNNFLREFVSHFLERASLDLALYSAEMSQNKRVGVSG